MAMRQIAGENWSAQAATLPTSLPRMSRFRAVRSWATAAAGGLIAVIIVPALINYSAGERAAIALCLFAFLFVVNTCAPTTGARMILVYLATMSCLRRWLVPFFGWTGTDPLLTIGPAMAVLAFLDIARTRQLPHDTRLTRLLLWLLCIMAFEVFNPLQGGLMVGFGGALYYVVPLLWFYLGHRLGPSALPGMLRATLVLALAATVYGLYHSLVGLLPFEQAWLKAIGPHSYSAIMIDDNVVRAFAFFTNAEEYSQFLAFGVVLLWIGVLRGRLYLLLPIGVLFAALLLESSRGIIVTALFACAIVWSVQGPTVRSWMPRFAGAIVLALAGLVWTMGQVQQHSFDDRTKTAMEHNAGGILNPLDQKKSTAVAHYNMVNDGVLRGFANPVGKGLGATTMAATRFGDEGGNTEMDVSNLFVSLGPVGGMVYIGVIIAALQTVGRCWLRTRSAEALCVLGMLAATPGQWLNGGYYSTVMALWFCVGAIHRGERDALE